MSFVSTTTAGNKHQEMKKLLDFYHDEIIYLQKRVTEIIQKNTGEEVTAEAEHFQNQFIIQLKNVNDYREELTKNKHLIFIDTKEHVGKVDSRLSNQALDLEKKILHFSKIFSDLKSSFQQYLSKWL